MIGYIKYKVAKILSVIGVVSMLYTTHLLAQTPSVAPFDANKVTTSVVDVAAKNPLLAIIYIEGLITFAAMFFAYLQINELRRSNDISRDMAVGLARLVEEMNNRPCVMEKHTPSDNKINLKELKDLKG